MSGVLERTLGILELLSEQEQGVELAVLAEKLNMPKSAAHRLLADLARLGRWPRGRDVLFRCRREPCAARARALTATYACARSKARAAGPCPLSRAPLPRLRSLLVGQYD